MNLRVGYVGFGNIGQAVLRFITDRKAFLWERHHLSLETLFAADIYGVIRSEQGLAPDLLLETLKRTGRVVDAPVGDRPNSLEEVFDTTPPDLIIESTWANYEDAQPGLGFLLSALSRGISVVSSNKGPFALGYGALKEAAERTGAEMRFGAAAPAAIPCINVAHFDLAACDILGFEAIVNDTTNYMLSQMTSEGRSFEESLQHVQEIGLAEKDPSLDVDGWDTAAKVVILANSMMGSCATLSNVVVAGIAAVTRQDVTSARQGGQVVKLIGSAQWGDRTLNLAVRPTSIPIEHPLARVEGLRKGIVFHTDVYGDITVYSGRMNLETSAATVVTDVINVARILAARR
jgi:homoserine dehydrogenase